jgi:hypothetical protein
VRSSWLAGLLLTIVSLAWNGGATAHVGHHATVADCCYEIAYDQYEEVYIWFVANGNRARMQGAYRATVSVHLRTLATAVTDPKYVHFLTVTEERAASMDEFDATEMRTPAPNRSAQPGPWSAAPDCYPTDSGSKLSYPAGGEKYVRNSAATGGLLRIDRAQKRTEVVHGHPIRDWKFSCALHYRDQRGGSTEGATPISAFNGLSFSSRAAAVLPLVNPNGKTTVCHVAGYQQVDLLGGDEVYQFKGTYSASIRIKKVPSGARKGEVRKLGKLQGQAPKWLPGVFDTHDDPGSVADVGPLSPNVPRTGCGHA